jgi:arylsulfatase A
MPKISRRDFLKLTGMAGSGLLFSCSSKQSAQPPNIILIMADDLGYETIGVNGCVEYQTPEIDRMAANGIRFEHCYSQPICTPSRVQIMTGKYNVRNYIDFGILDPDATTFAHLLKDVGYHTCIAGKWQLGRDRELINHFGFDEYCLWWLENKGQRYGNVGELIQNGELLPGGDGEYGPDVVSDFLLDFITRHKEERFFCYYPMMLTHSPFEPTPDQDEYDPDLEGWLSELDNFDDNVAYMDKIVGKIVKHVRDLGLAENTLILFTGDNGTHREVVTEMKNRTVQGGKGKMTNAGTHVPLIGQWPAVIPSGTVSQHLIDFSDFLPTFCDAAKVTIPAELTIDGQSFLPILQGKEVQGREWVYFWYCRNPGERPLYIAARTRQYKLYADGDFYDVKNDPLEEHPMPAAELSEKEKETKQMLQSVLDRYKNARPDHLQ